MFIEVERKDGRRAILRVDSIVSIMEDELPGKNGVRVPILQIQAGLIKIEVINDTPDSLFARMHASLGRPINCIPRDGIDETKRARFVSEPITVIEIPAPAVAHKKAIAK